MTPSLRRRLAPAVLCALLGITAAGLFLGLSGARLAEARAVRALWAALDSWDTRREAAALWDLSAASPGVQRQILAASLRREPSAGLAAVIHAAVGLRAADGALLVDLFLPNAAHPPSGSGAPGGLARA